MTDRNTDTQLLEQALLQANILIDAQQEAIRALSSEWLNVFQAFADAQLDMPDSVEEAIDKLRELAEATSR